MPRKTITSEQDVLEDLALATYEEIMANPSVKPEIRIDAADKALRSLGKAEPAKQSGQAQIVFNFGAQISKSLLGVGEAVKLMKPAEDQETGRVDE